MSNRIRIAMALPAMLAVAAATSRAGDNPPEVPATRPELKAFLEASKQNVPRLPMPPLSEADREKIAHANWGAADWSIYNNGRTRKHYLPPELADVSSLRADDPAMRLGYRFQTMLFWIVSRANNCTYCTGHQESKLAAAGMSDDQIAGLDGDWSEFSPKERAAFALTRKLTFEPHRLGDEDVAAARRHFDDIQVLEIINAVSNFNAMNRWTGALRIPQEGHRAYLIGTSPRHRISVSRVAPLDPEAHQSGPRCARPARRPALEARAEVEEALARCQAREPRLPLVPEEKARAILGGSASEPLPQWMRLLATFAKAGKSRVAVHVASETKGTLAPILRAQIAWIAARNDRAWYALGHARNRLAALGQDDEAIFALDRTNHDAFPPDRRAVITLARKLTVDPALVADEDMNNLRKHFSDKDVAEIVFQITEAAYFNRLTEAAGLRLEK